MFTVKEFDIPSNGLRSRRKYPWDELTEIGKGFWIPDHCNVGNVKTAAYSAGLRLGQKFVVRKVQSAWACVRIA